MSVPRVVGAGLVAAIVAVALGACGGGGSSSTSSTVATSDRAQILAVAKRYTSAFLDGDYATACSLMTAQARQQMTQAAAAAKLGGGTCAGIMQAAAGTVPSDEKGALRGLKLSIVSLAGDHAVVRTTTAGGQSDTTAVQRTGGIWRVDANL